MDCSGDSPKRKSRWKNFVRKDVENEQREVISTEKSSEIPHKRFATSLELRRRSYWNRKSKLYKKNAPKNFHLQESVPSFLPSSFPKSSSLSKEIFVHKIELKSRQPNRNVNAKSYGKKAKSRHYLQQSAPWFIPSLSNGLSKEIVQNNKKKTEQESRSHRNFISKSSNKIPSKRFHLHESIPSFLPSSPNDISKQVSLQIPSVKLSSSGIKAASKAQKPSMCQHKVVLRNVRLKHGRKVATFELRGRIGSIVKCVERCCRRRWCNLAYKVGAYCYSVHCPTHEACEPVKVKDSRMLSDYVLLDRPQDVYYSKFNFLF